MSNNDKPTFFESAYNSLGAIGELVRRRENIIDQVEDALIQVDRLNDRRIASMPVSTAVEAPQFIPEQDASPKPLAEVKPDIIDLDEVAQMRKLRAAAQTKLDQINAGDQTTARMNYPEELQRPAAW